MNSLTTARFIPYSTSATRTNIFGVFSSRLCSVTALEKEFISAAKSSSIPTICDICNDIHNYQTYHAHLPFATSRSFADVLLTFDRASNSVFTLASKSWLTIKVSRNWTRPSQDDASTHNYGCWARQPWNRLTAFRFRCLNRKASETRARSGCDTSESEIYQHHQNYPQCCWHATCHLPSWQNLFFFRFHSAKTDFKYVTSYDTLKNEKYCSAM